MDLGYKVVTLGNPAANTITTGGTAQTIYPANPNRRYLLIENLDATNVLWIDFGVAAVAAAPAIRLSAGGTFSMEHGIIDQRAVSVVGANTGQAFSAKEG